MFQREAESLTRNQQQMPFKVLEHLFPARRGARIQTQNGVLPTSKRMMRGKGIIQQGRELRFHIPMIRELRQCAFSLLSPSLNKKRAAESRTFTCSRSENNIKKKKKSDNIIDWAPPQPPAKPPSPLPQCRTAYR